MDQLRELYEEYLLTAPANNEIEPFLDWLEAGQAEREAESKELFEFMSRGWKRVLGFALTSGQDVR